MKVNGSQMDWFSSLSFCVQWREESDKPLMGNRPVCRGFELHQPAAWGCISRASFHLLAPMWFLNFFFLVTTTALRKYASCIRADSKSTPSSGPVSQALQLVQQRNNSPLSTQFELLSLGSATVCVTCQVNESLDWIISICYLYEAVQVKCWQIRRYSFIYMSFIYIIIYSWADLQLKRLIVVVAFQLGT